MKYLCVLFLLLVCTVGAYAESPYVQILDEQWHNHSGVVIKSGKTIEVLTCSHMVMFNKSTHINVKFFNGEEYISLPAKIKKMDHSRDLMLLSVDNRANIIVDAVRISDFVENVNCIIYGYSFKDQKIIQATYNPVVTTADGHELYSFNGFGVSGMSGSAILSNNKIVSIQSAGKTGSIVGASIKEIKEFLDE
jgi:hypothetical protein